MGNIAYTSVKYFVAAASIVAGDAVMKAVVKKTAKVADKAKKFKKAK